MCRRTRSRPPTRTGAPACWVTRRTRWCSTTPNCAVSCPAGDRRGPERGHGQARGGLDRMTTTARDVLAAARGLADDLLFPDAMRVDRLDVLPVTHLDALAALGLYGAPVRVQACGLGLDLAASCAVVEELASGCLATTARTGLRPSFLP